MRPRGDEVLAVGGGEAEGGHFFDVRTGWRAISLMWKNGSGRCILTGKCLFTSSDYNRANTLVAVVIAQSFIELLHERRAQCIEGLGSIQRD